jgi:multidrug efflux system outer membrane protein
MAPAHHFLGFREPSDQFRRTVGAAGAVAALLGGCAVVGPPYQPPQGQWPSAWQTVLPHGGSVDQLADWWGGFDDPAVVQLIRWAEVDSPTIAKAAANIEAARATLASRNAQGKPSVTAGVSAGRSRQLLGNSASVDTTLSGSLDSSWEIDLFGKLRRGRQAAQARIEARLADWHEARISVAAEIADTYVQYRACRMIESGYADDVASQRDTLRITGVSALAGLSARADLDLASAAEASAESTWVAEQATCESLVKALVALTGTEEDRLRPLIDRPSKALPTPQAFAVASLPSDLLRQRPDVASSERELAASSAEIGQADADRYPSFSLGGSISVSASPGTSPLTTWSFGPSLSVPAFDGGARRAAVDSARAVYNSSLASYRSTVRDAVREVEQALVALQGASIRSGAARQAAGSYRRYVAATEVNWRAGGTSLLALEEARRSATVAETTLVTLERDQVRDWIALYKALGGGWQTIASDADAATGGKP